MSIYSVKRQPYTSSGIGKKSCIDRVVSSSLSCGKQRSRVFSFQNIAERAKRNVSKAILGASECDTDDQTLVNDKALTAGTRRCWKVAEAKFEESWRHDARHGNKPQVIGIKFMQRNNAKLLSRKMRESFLLLRLVHIAEYGTEYLKKKFR